MLYEEYETNISQENLKQVGDQLKQPVCILGGWAVYFTVNENFKKTTGTNYHGSKDIDLGFHLDLSFNELDIKNSDLLQSISALEKIGFYHVGFRLVQHYNRETQKPITIEESKKIPYYTMFDLYVDPLVDNIPKKLKDVLGFVPPDEPLLRYVFEHKKSVMVKEFGINVMLPLPEILLATKLNSLPKRTKDHKRIKDIIDIYALIWHSKIDITKLKKNILEIVSQKTISKVLSVISKQDFVAASIAINIGTDEVENVINAFITTNAPMSKSDDKFRIPFNVNNESYNVILKGLLLQKADAKKVSLDQLYSATGLNKNTLSLNLSFLKSVNVVDGDGKLGYQLTSLGLNYCKSHYNGNQEEIKKMSKQLVENSHLKKLNTFLSVKTNAKPMDFFNQIKMEGRFSEGDTVTGLIVPWSSGARVLLKIFNDAELLSESFNNEFNVMIKNTKSQRKTKITTSTNNKNVKK